MRLFPLLLLHLLWDTLVLFIILRIALREHSPASKSLGLVCFGAALGKSLLYSLLGVLATVPVLLSSGLFLGWAYSLSTRNILCILAAFLSVGIVFGSVLRMAHGVLELFFV